MRVAHFIQRYPPALGGSEAYFARLSRYLHAQGDHVTVFTSNALDLDAFWNPRGRCLSSGISIEDGVEVRRYPLKFRFRGRRWLFKLLSLFPHQTWRLLCQSWNPIAPQMWREAGRSHEAFDIVHASCLPYGWPLACGLRLARTLHIPFLVTPFLHTGDPDDPRDRTRHGYLRPELLGLLRAADRIFVQTGIERDALAAAGISPDRLIVQGLGVDAAECTGGNRHKARGAWGAREEAVIGHLANNSEEKGTTDLLRAASRAWKQGAQFRVVLAGPEMPNFRRFWASFAGRARVQRLGALSDEQKRDFFAGIDVFALPSRSDSFGLVLLEAWANGVPNVGYRAGGIAGVIRHEQDGLLVRCGDIEGLAAALMRLETDAKLCRRFGFVGQQRTRTEFRWQDKLTLVREVYSSL